MKRDDKSAIRLCIVGGAPREPGGVEIFCERALAAVCTHWVDGDTIWLPADTTHLRPARLPALIRGLCAFRRAHRAPIDVVWLNISNLPDLLYLYFAKWLGIPVLITLHMGANSRLQRYRPVRRLYQSLLRRADRIALLFDGQDSEIDLPASVPRSTIRTFLPRDSFRSKPMPESADGVLRLIHAGRLSEGKGSLLMVDMCAALARAGIPFEARIIGRGDEAVVDELHARIAASGLGSRITLSPWLDAPALSDALRAADLLIHLSRLDSFPLIVLEAMAADTIPVAIDMTGVRSMTGAYGGHLVDPGDAAADAARWIAGQPLAELRRRGRAMGIAVRRDYDWRECVAALSAAIAHTLADT